MTTSFRDLFQALVEHGVDFVVVGGVAAILEGAPMTTLDLDVVYQVSDDNLSRLASALSSIDARYRDPAGRVIEPTVSRLRSYKVNLLETRCGFLDALQEIGGGWGYAEVAARSIRMEIWGFEVKVLSLSAVMESKEIAGRPKDTAQRALLEETLRQQMKLER